MQSVDMMEGTVVMIYLIMIIVLNVFVIKTIQVNFAGNILFMPN